jgi:hypothetical protein
MIRGWRRHSTSFEQFQGSICHWIALRSLLRNEHSVMRAFAFWYVAFFFGGTVGALAGSNVGESGGLMLGLIAGMALIAWAVHLFPPAQLFFRLSPSPAVSHSIGEPEQTASPGQKDEPTRVVTVDDTTVGSADVQTL